MTKEEIKERILNTNGYRLMAKKFPNTENELIYNVGLKDRLKVEEAKLTKDDKYFYGVISGIGMIGIQDNAFSEIPFEELNFKNSEQIDNEIYEYGNWS